MESPAKRSPLVIALPWLVWSVLAARLLARYDRMSVDLFFWDEWDYRTGFFEGASAWQLFDWQHGPHRMGLGNLIARGLYELTRWNVRAEALAAALCYIAAAALAVALVQRLCGPSQWNALVPLCVLTGLLADSAASVPNLSHGPLPLVLVLLFAWAMVALRGSARLISLLVLDFLALFTGFGLVLAPLTRGLLLLWTVFPPNDSAGLHSRWPPLLALLASSVGPALFMQGYLFAPAVECFIFPHPHPSEYLSFVSLLLERPLGISGVGGLRALVAFGTPLLEAGALLVALVAAYRTHGVDPRALAVILLTLFSFSFAALTAVGRVCLGIDAAAATRYVPYALPALLALVVAIRAWAPAVLQPRALGALLAVFVVKEALVSLRPIRETTLLVDGKQRSRECLLDRAGDAAICERESGFALHPNPTATRLQEKLDWLRAQRLGPFRDR